MDRDHFLEHSRAFIVAFKPKYIDFFVSLCVSYDSVVDKKEAQAMAEMIYETLFTCAFGVKSLDDSLLIKMRQDGVMVGFMLSRSMIYLLENYIEYEAGEGSVEGVGFLVECVSKLINRIEKDLIPSTLPPLGEFDVRFNEFSMPFGSIIETFQKLKDERRTVRFLNLYQGVPVSKEARIVAIDGENVTFQTDRLQEIAMKLDGKAFIIKDDYFAKHLKADIVYSNLTTNTVTLNNFIYLLNMPALQRESVRVHPDIVATVYLHQANATAPTEGRLYDLSLQGLGVLSSQNRGIRLGAHVNVSFSLDRLDQKSDERIEVEGEVVNIIENRGTYRYCMKIAPSTIMQERIVRYIQMREKEIIESLEDELRDYIVT